MARIVITELTKTFPGTRGKPVSAVRELTLTIESGECLALVGPSGCGKTTLLRLIAGLEIPDSGGLSVAGKDWCGVPAQDREVAMVFQQPSLFPHLTVRENLSLGLRLRRVPRGEAERRVAEVAEKLGLPECLERRPAQLSGGQSQRVALGRALVRRPKVLLLDEPFSQLDAPLRGELRRLVRQLHQELSLTVVHVTHDQSEALAVGQRVAVMSGGELQQVGTPKEVYQTPNNLRVAHFIGSPPMNLLPGWLRQTETGICFNFATDLSAEGAEALRFWPPPPQAERLAAWIGREIVLGIRAEQLSLRQHDESGANVRAFTACVREVEALGGQTHLALQLGGARALVVSEGDSLPVVGQRVRVGFRPESAVFFDPATGQRVA